MAAKRTKAQREADKRYDAKRKGTRHRVWTCIFYPDSMPELVWLMLAALHMHIWVSPVHDRDTWTKLDEKKDSKHKAGTLKKPHFHLVVEYSQAVTKEQFMADFGFLNGVDGTYVKDKVSMIRYLIHRDDPKKAQYSVDDLQVFGGADAGLVNEIGSGEEHEMLRSMRQYIRDNDIRYFSDFVDYCDDCQKSWSRLLNNKCYAIKAYIADRRRKAEDNAEQTANEQLKAEREEHERVLCDWCMSEDVKHVAIDQDGVPLAACEAHADGWWEYVRTHDLTPTGSDASGCEASPEPATEGGLYAPPRA